MSTEESGLDIEEGNELPPPPSILRIPELTESDETQEKNLQHFQEFTAVRKKQAGVYLGISQDEGDSQDGEVSQDDELVCSICLDGYGT